jgi:hypothetical protein
VANLDSVRMPRVRKPRMPRMTNLGTALCTKILRIRKAYGDRRARAHKTIVVASRPRSRRERARVGRLSSMMMLKTKLRGKLRREDKDDRRKINRANAGNKREAKRALKCLEEATLSLDIVVQNPKLIRDRKYMKWERSLDFFLAEMRSMVEYKLEPGQYEVDILELLIRRLSQMKISEHLAAQEAVRNSLMDAVGNMFEDTERKFRMRGL